MADPQFGWFNPPANVVTFQWRRCNSAGALASCTSIAGATSRDYTLAPADADHTLLVRVKGTSSGLSRVLTSAPTSVVTFADRDGDGVTGQSDCDDANPAIHPGAFDVPGNGVDENCDGIDAADAGGGGGGTGSDTAPPGLELSLRKQRLDGTIEVQVTADEAGTATGEGKMTVKPAKGGGGKGNRAASRFNLKPASGDVVPGRFLLLRLKVPKKAQRKGTKALKQGGKVKIALTATATDAAGNSATDDGSTKLKPPKN